MDVESMIDPEIAEVLRDLPIAELNAETLPLARSAIDRRPRPRLSDMVERTERVAPGDVAVGLRIHRPKSATGALPCVFSIHGGGYVTGSAVLEDERFDAWCPQLGIVGVSVEYRLAPETPFPGALDDCYQGLTWVHENAASLGIDRARIGVHGVSAGGGLAAALALLVRDRDELRLRCQALDSPMLDDRQITYTSQLDGLHAWTKESNRFGWRSYLGPLFGTDGVPYTAAPARAVDLSGLPVAFVSVGAIDGFRDEDVDYALRLNNAGVPTELHVYPNAPHAYQLAPASDIARRARRDMTGWLARQLAAE